METKTKYLTISEALHLYEILNPYLPSFHEVGDMLQYARKIIDNIVLSGNVNDYFRALYLVSGIDPDKATRLAVNKTLLAFMQGLLDNEILFLKSFGESLWPEVQQTTK